MGFNTFEKIQINTEKRAIQTWYQSKKIWKVEVPIV